MSSARLVSINVGRPKDVAWHGRTVHTGVWKSPVSGPRLVRRLNIDGDGQGDLAGHGGEMRAVLVYQLDSYRHWERELDRQDFAPGQFGENFTVDGLPDDEVCIGDRYRIGGALFEVTQPRVTCYRVGLRMNEPRMPSLLVAHGRPGFYLRVLEEGEVEAGQEIVRVAEGPGRLTVAEVDALLYRGRHPREELERALRVDALSPGWRASFQALLEKGPAAGNVGLTGEAAAPPPAWAGFRALAVTRIVEESRGVRSLWLEAPDGGALPAPAPGQYLTLRLDAGDGGPPLVRSYSLSGPPDSGSYRISVKREPHGAAGTVLHTRVAVGDRLQVAAPRGTFTLADGTAPVVLASAGVGATPLLAMLNVLAEAGSQRQVWWLHGARDGGGHVFAAESRRLLARLPGARVRICYSHPRAQDREGPDYREGTDYTDAGHLDAGVLERAGVPADAEAYLCGPVSFMADLGKALAGRGVAAGRIHTEVFGTAGQITPGIAATTKGPPHAPEGPAGTGPAVTFVRSALTVPWDDRHGTLLELAEACDVPVRWSCRTGVCHTCETGLLGGDVAYDPDPLDAPAEGNALICCSRPARDVVLDL